MSGPKLIPPDVVAQARRLYEESDVPVIDICKLLGINESTFYRRLRKWNWQTRTARTLSAEQQLALDASNRTDENGSAAPDSMAQPSAIAPDKTADAGPALHKIDMAALTAQVKATIEQRIAMTERLLRTVDSNSVQTGQAERAARTLAMYVRTLREVHALSGLIAGEESESEEEAFRDADEFRRELQQRLERIRNGAA